MAAAMLPDGGQQGPYGERVAAVEPYSIEQVPVGERHGRPRNLLWLWLAANLTIADYALGFLPVTLGLGWAGTIAALAVGNLLGGALLGLASAMGPGAGYPQMFIGRLALGRIGGYLPATLNWISTVGWFTVNTILGAFAVRVVLPDVPFWAAATALALVQCLVATLGHNLIHAFERWMALVLALLFAASTGIALSHWNAVISWHPRTSTPTWAAFGIVLAASFSYVVSWAPYASDYSRYLPERSRKLAVTGWTFAGAAVASFWLEALGVLIAVLAGPAKDPVAGLDSVLGGFGTWAVVAVILGAVAANALNLYSNALSARVLDVRLPRWGLVWVGAAVGVGLSLAGAGNFSNFYQSFLLLLDYWITPWLAVILLDYFWRRRRDARGFSDTPAVRWPGVLAYLIGIGASVPFMSQQFFTGPVAAKLDGADISYWVGFVVAGISYLVLCRVLPAMEAVPSSR